MGLSYNQIEGKEQLKSAQDHVPRIAFDRDGQLKLGPDYWGN
jgi:hypothetical protein